MDTDKQKLPLLENSPFFRNFDRKALEALLPLLHEERFDADQPICFKGDESESVYLIRDGQATVSVSSKDGKIIVLGTLSRGDVFGEVGLFDNQPRTADVTAKTDIMLYRLNSKDFEKLAAMFSLKEWKSMTTYVCERFRGAINNLEETAFLDTGVRVLKKILELHEKSPEKDRNTFKLTISQEQLGRMVGLSREATNKILSRLAAIGMIERKYKNILVPDIARLKQAVEKEEV